MSGDDGWIINKQNTITLFIITFLVIIFVLEIAILIFDTTIQDSTNIMLAFTALLFTFSVVSIEYSNHDRIKKYNLDGQFFRASQNFVISVVIMLFVYAFSKINILTGSGNFYISWFGKQIAPFSSPIIVLALFLLLFEVSTATWILLKASFQAYKKYYDENSKH